MKECFNEICNETKQIKKRWSEISDEYSCVKIFQIRSVLACVWVLKKEKREVKKTKRSWHRKWGIIWEIVSGQLSGNGFTEVEIVGRDGMKIIRGGTHHHGDVSLLSVRTRSRRVKLCCCSSNGIFLRLLI